MALEDSSGVESELRRLRLALQAVTDASRNQFSPKLLIEHRRISEQILIAERKVAQSQGHSFAEPFHIPYEWSMSSSAKVLIRSPHSASIAYNHLKNSGGIAVITLMSLYKITYGGPNDEARHGHPLTGRGLAPYGASVVNHSKWVSKEKLINSVHHQYSEEDWSTISHFILCFHDIQIEALAKDLECHQVSTSLDLWAMNDKEL